MISNLTSYSKGLPSFNVHIQSSSVRGGGGDCHSKILSGAQLSGTGQGICQSRTLPWRSILGPRRWCKDSRHIHEAPLTQDRFVSSVAYILRVTTGDHDLPENGLNLPVHDALENKMTSIQSDNESVKYRPELELIEARVTANTAVSQLLQTSNEFEVPAVGVSENLSSTKTVGTDENIVCRRSLASLRGYLAQPGHRDFSSLGSAEFVSWLQQFVASKNKNDDIFRQRVHICNLMREHKQEHAPLQLALKEVEDKLKEAGMKDIILNAYKELHSARQAQAGLTGFLQASEGKETEHGKLSEKVSQAKQKLVDVQEKLPSLEARCEELVQACPAWTEVERSKDALDAFECQVGLTAARDHLQALCHMAGSATSASGRSFEDACTSILHAIASTELVDAQRLSQLGRRVEVLSNVTLGIASGEIDKMVVVAAPEEEEEVQVLALMECKQSMDDLAYSFLHYQKMLGWLTGDRKSYSPEDFRTRVYRQGHFDKRVAHAQAGRRYVFGPGSFSGFRRDAHTDYFLKGLMLAGNVKSFGGGTLSGLDSKGSNLIAHRVSTDERFQPAMEAGDVDYFERLHAWAKTANKSHLTTREVLGIYARNEELAGHILLLEFDKRRKNVQVDRKSEDSVRLLNNPAA